MCILKRLIERSTKTQPIIYPQNNDNSNDDEDLDLMDLYMLDDDFF